MRGFSQLKKIKKPKELRAFIFFIVASLCLFEFGRSLKNLFTGSYFQIISAKSPYLSFVYLENTGGAFNILPQFTPLLAFFAFFACGVVAIYVYQELTLKDRLLMGASTLAFGGILGNFIERITQGYVVDYIKLKFVDFAVFNAFDVMICAGAALFCYKIIFNEIFKKRNVKR
jgi:signal peptidase II